MTPQIKNIVKIFGSRAKSQEVLLLLEGIKPAVRQGFYENELNAVKEFCKKNNIFFVKSKFKVLITEKDASYSNRGLRIKENDPRKGMFFVYLSLNEKSAYLAAYYEQVLDHLKLGEILGYPKCCIEYFCKNFSENNTNPELKPTNPYTNLSKRDKDYVLLSHFPCDSECKESIELAKKYLITIQKTYPKHAEKLLSELSMF